MATEEQSKVSGHTGNKVYWKVGGMLALLTALEVAVVYIESLSSILIPLLVIMSLAKFALVAIFFMHLKVDSRVYTAFFVIGIVLALGTFIGLLAMADGPSAVQAVSGA